MTRPIKPIDSAVPREVLRLIRTIHPFDPVNTLIEPVKGEASHFAGLIRLSPTARAPYLAYAHEVGHHLTDMMMLPFERRHLMNAIKKTRMWRKLRQLTPTQFNARMETPFKPKEARKNLSYYRSDSEMLARAYAEYIALRTFSRRMIRDLVKTSAIGGEFETWSGDDFKGVVKAFDQVLERFQW